MDKYPKGHLLCSDHGIYDHIGISDGKGYVYENAYRTGGRGKVTVKEFAGGCKVIDIGFLPGSPAPDRIIENAENAIADKKRYNLLFNNCEHFVREVCEVDIKSPQVHHVIFGALGTALALKSKTPEVKGAITGAAIGTVLSKGSKSVLKNSFIGASLGLLAGFAVRLGKKLFRKKK